MVLAKLETLADWSAWLPFAEAGAIAPKDPGVYMAREGAAGSVVYIGMAGERRGEGLRGRLSVYGSGKALASGLGEAVFDRALADVDWLRQRVIDVEAGAPARAKEWGRLAFQRADLQMRWATTANRTAAAVLELERVGAPDRGAHAQEVISVAEELMKQTAEVVAASFGRATKGTSVGSANQTTDAPARWQCLAIDPDVLPSASRGVETSARSVGRFYAHVSDEHR